MKKFVSMLLCVAMVVLIGMTNASAAAIEETENTYGKLYNEEGNLVATIVGKRVDAPAVCMDGGQEEISETYRFDVLSSIVNHEDSASSQDAYYCVTAYLTLTYRERQDEPSVYLLTNVSGSWTTPNDSRVSVPEAVLLYQCMGFGPDQLYTDEQKGEVNLNVSTRYFNINTVNADLKL